MRLETKRLILREWTRKDIPDSMEGVGNLEVSKWLALVPHPYTRKDAGAWIDYCIKCARKGDKRDAYHFAIELKNLQGKVSRRKGACKNVQCSKVHIWALYPR